MDSQKIYATIRHIRSRTNMGNRSRNMHIPHHRKMHKQILDRQNTNHKLKPLLFTFFFKNKSSPTNQKKPNQTQNKPTKKLNKPNQKTTTKKTKQQKNKKPHNLKKTT